MKALIKKAFDEAFGRFDCLLGPVAPTTAPQLGKSLTAPLRMYLGDIYTISVNLAASRCQPSLRSEQRRAAHWAAADRRLFSGEKTDPCGLYPMNRREGSSPLARHGKEENAKTADGTVNAGTDGKEA